MFSSFPARPGRTEQTLTPAPLYKRQQRASVACTNCRSRKIRCIPTPEDRHKEDKYRDKPCERCAKRKLVCEYLPVSVELESTRASNSPGPSYIPYPGAADPVGASPQPGIIPGHLESGVGVGRPDWLPTQSQSTPQYGSQLPASLDPEGLHQPLDFGQWAGQPSGWSTYTSPNDVFHQPSTLFDPTVTSHAWTPSLGNHHTSQYSDGYAQGALQYATQETDVDTNDRSTTTWPAH
ncbi:hypothetical protein BDZ89DRAFT_1133457 [Hymenopellis radicata]|nr:hypothetical protein BDZ89DRAFT_1133457 [Hymenopellis radicata]